MEMPMTAPKLSLQKIFFYLTVLVVGSLLVAALDIYPLIAPGDHGRDFYAFEKTLEGQEVYRDYWWVYGPLMPYYYAGFYKMFGMNMLSILLARAILLLCSSTLVYLILSTVTSPFLSFLGALWLLTFNNDFYFTFNHVGGIVMILANVYAAFLYMRNQNTIYLFAGLGAIFLLCLIKINFGVSTLVSFLLSISLIRLVKNQKLFAPNKQFYVWALILTPVLIAGIYLYCLRGLPMYEIRQCLPYLAEDHPYHCTVWQGIVSLTTSIGMTMTRNIPNGAFAILILLSLGLTLRRFYSKDISIQHKKTLFLSLAIPAIYYVLNMHEFIVSGVTYRQFWATPMQYVIMFLLFSVTLQSVSKVIRFGIYASIASLLMLQNLNNLNLYQQIRNPYQYIHLNRGKIFTTNHYLWVDTVIQTTHFLNANLKKDETFFAIPYDTLFHFLTDRDSPTRQLIFFEHINIPREQEEKIIRELEAKKVNWIVLSNRTNSDEEGLGLLGKDYCPLIGAYIQNNFTVAAEYGDWVNPAGWAWNYGIRILRRK
jgi:hypothetical protein